MMRTIYWKWVGDTEYLFLEKTGQTDGKLIRVEGKVMILKSKKKRRPKRLYLNPPYLYRRESHWIREHELIEFKRQIARTPISL
jgi:hypothetical protein